MKKKVYLQKTPNGSFRIRLKDESGKWWSKTFKTKTEAQILERAIKQDEPLDFWFDRTTLKSTGNMSFKSLSELWFDHATYVRGLSKACLKNYKNHLDRHILPQLGQIDKNQLKLTDVEDLAAVLKQTKPVTSSYTAIRKSWDHPDQDAEGVLSASYRIEILIVALMVTKWACERGYLKTNPFESFDLPDRPEQPFEYWRLEDEDKFFDWVESGAFYEKQTDRYSKVGKEKHVMKLQLRNAAELRDIVLFALRSGMRLGEIGGLRMSDVNLVEKWVRIRASYSFTEKRIKNSTKTGKFRIIEMNQDMYEILWKRRFTPESEPVFNIRMNSIKFFSRTCRLARVREIHFHALRHTCLTNLANGYGLDRPLPITQVQKIAGHTDLKMTQKYIHTHGIEGTGSRQMSREERKALKASPTRSENQTKKLRLVN